MKSFLTYQELDSTLLEYERLQKTGAEEDRYVIRAAVQTAGKGRNEAQWHSPEGGLWLTFDFRYSLPVPSFPLYIGACLHKLLHRLFPLQQLRIKWPNDLYLGAAKVAGILCQYQPAANRYIIGIGINTNTVKDDILLSYAASVLAEQIGFPVSNLYLARLLLQAVEADSALLHTPASYLDYCNLWLWGRNRLAEAHLNGGGIRGRILGIDDQGCLLLQDQTGQMRQIAQGSLRILD